MFPFIKTIASIKRAKLISLMISCALLALLIVIILIVLITWGASYLAEFKTEWMNALVTSFAGVLSGVAGWFMLPSLTILIGGIFQETVIHRVEKRYYPDKMRKESPKFWPDFFHDIKFTIKSLILNILIFPTYFFAIGFIISILLNT
ncbi:MAG: EI24 domain-containing protein, partial [Calditrichaceae bacterium]|nr:EI24 domain-containing protein [Calditrichaceae bacterium]